MFRDESKAQDFCEETHEEEDAARNPQHHEDLRPEELLPSPGMSRGNG